MCSIAILIRLDVLYPVKPVNHLNLIYSVELVLEGLSLQIIMRYAQNHGDVNERAIEVAPTT